MNMHVAIPATLRPTPGPALPGEEEAFGATHRRASFLSPIPRAAALPTHHPGRRCPDASSYPYPIWSGTLSPDAGDSRPGVVRLRGSRLTAVIDLDNGARLRELATARGTGLVTTPSTTVDGEDARGCGLRGGLEWNPSPLRRSPLALEPVHATTALPSRLGGERLRWWELERSTGYLCQVDLHLPDDEPILLIAVRQVALAAAVRPDEATFAMLVDHAHWDTRSGYDTPGFLTGGTRVSVLGDVTRQTHSEVGIHLSGRTTPQGHVVRWAALAVETADADHVRQLARQALDGLDDPIATGARSLLSTGSDWAALEIVRLTAREPATRSVPAATPISALAELDDVSARLRDAPEQQWLHLFHDQGLGATDRVHPSDVGQAAGKQWHHELRRAHQRESLGDWRVHLRLGELAHLEGNLSEARARWEWSHALRPTVWAERNLALNDLASGRRQEAAVRYLRAHRIDPHELELGVEAVGCLLLAARVDDCETVLDRMAVHAQNASARYWLLQAEVATRTGDGERVRRSIEAAGQCPDVSAWAPWRSAIENAARD